MRRLASTALKERGKQVKHWLKSECKED